MPARIHWHRGPHGSREWVLDRTMTAVGRAQMPRSFPRTTHEAAAPEMDAEELDHRAGGQGAARIGHGLMEREPAREEVLDHLAPRQAPPATSILRRAKSSISSRGTISHFAPLETRSGKDAMNPSWIP